MNFMEGLFQLMKHDLSTKQIENFLSESFTLNGKTFLCCILKKINDFKFDCKEIENVQPLGEKGKVGIPYLIKMNQQLFVLKITPNISLKIQQERSSLTIYRLHVNIPLVQHHYLLA